MTKTFCDICNQEIIPSSKSYSIDIKESKDYGYESHMQHVCEDCKGAIHRLILCINRRESFTWKV